MGKVRARVRVEEPEFMRGIHRIRAELAKMTRSEYASYLRNVREKYRKELGHLYVRRKGKKSAEEKDLPR